MKTLSLSDLIARMGVIVLIIGILVFLLAPAFSLGPKKSLSFDSLVYESESFETSSGFTHKEKIGYFIPDLSDPHVGVNTSPVPGAGILVIAWVHTTYPYWFDVSFVYQTRHFVTSCNFMTEYPKFDLCNKHSY